MNRLILIIALGFLSLLLGSPSCNDSGKRQAEEKELKVLRDSLKGEFSGAAPDQMTLASYEQAAILKISDLGDYLQVILNKNLALPFRQRTAEQAQSLFSHQEVKISLGLSPGGKVETHPFREMIERALADNFEIQEFGFDSVTIKTPLRKTGNDRYIGELIFRQVFKPAKKPMEKSIQKSVEMILQPTEKSFGKEKLRLWAITLGEMR